MPTTPSRPDEPLRSRTTQLEFVRLAALRDAALRAGQAGLPWPELKASLRTSLGERLKARTTSR